MNNMATEEAINLENLQAHLIPSKKFKTISIELKLKTFIRKDTITKRAILPFVLRKGSKKYPSATLIQEKLDDLYGASLEIIGQKFGSYHVVSVQMEIPNEKFIENETAIVTDTLAFMKEIVFNPYTENGAFNEAIAKREKETIRKYLQSIKDDKMSYANYRLIDEMSEGEAYQVHSYGYEEDLDTINAKNLFAYYQQMVDNDQVDLFVVGDFDEKEMKESINLYLDGFRSAKTTPSIQPEMEVVKQISHTQPKVVIEKDSVQQAKLHMGYRTNTAFKDPDFPAMLLCHTMLGGHPGSKLFVNVRERHSLAYYVASGLDFFSDKLFVFSGIAPEDYKKARKIIEQQLIEMQDGAFTSSELEEAKSLIISEHRSSLDNAGGIIDLLYQQEIGNKKRSVGELIPQIEQVHKEDVVRSANKIQPDTFYLLTSKEVE